MALTGPMDNSDLHGTHWTAEEERPVACLDLHGTHWNVEEERPNVEASGSDTHGTHWNTEEKGQSQRHPVQTYMERS